MKDKFEQIINHFTDNEFEKSLNIINESLDDGNLKDNSILLLSRIQDFNNKVKLGILSNNEQEIALNKMRISILSLIKEFKKHLKLNNFSIEKTKSFFDRNNSSRQIHFGTGDNIIGNKVINNHKK